MSISGKTRAFTDPGSATVPADSLSWAADEHDIEQAAGDLVARSFSSAGLVVVGSTVSVLLPVGQVAMRSMRVADGVTLPAA